MPIEIDSEATFQAVLSDTTLILADFYAGWCEPCKWLDLILENMKNELPSGAQIIKIDVEKHLELSSGFDVRSVPVLIIFKNGEEVWRINGFLMKEGLLQKLEEFSRGT